MPKKKGKPVTKILIVVVLIAIISVGVVGWHDGILGTTPCGDINDLSVDSGTTVRVRGEITIILLTAITLSDGTGGVIFQWAGPATLNSIVVVTGVVQSAHFLHLVSSVDVVWIFSQASS